MASQVEPNTAQILVPSLFVSGCVNCCGPRFTSDCSWKEDTLGYLAGDLSCDVCRVGIFLR